MTDDPRIAALPDIHGHAKGEHKPFAEERPIPYTARMLFLWFFHACRRGSPRFLMVADHMNYLTFEDPAAVNLVRRALKLAQAGDLYGAAETAGVELGHAAAVSDGLRKGMRYSIGAEIDNDPRCRPDAQNIVDAMRPDGMVRSVHFLPIAHPQHGENWMWPFDNPEFKDLFEVVGTERTWEIYMTVLLEAVEKLPGNIIGHFYVPAKFGHWPEDATLEGYEDRLLDACAEHGQAVEVNSRYFYKFYAGDEAQIERYRTAHLRLLRKAKEKGVMIAVGSDAHSPKDQGGAFDAVLALLDEAGVNEIAFPIGGRLARVALRATDEILRQHAAALAPPIVAAPAAGEPSFDDAEDDDEETAAAEPAERPSLAVVETVAVAAVGALAAAAVTIGQVRRRKKKSADEDAVPSSPASVPVSSDGATVVPSADEQTAPGEPLVNEEPASASSAAAAVADDDGSLQTAGGSSADDDSQTSRPRDEAADEAAATADGPGKAAGFEETFPEAPAEPRSRKRAKPAQDAGNVPETPRAVAEPDLVTSEAAASTDSEPAGPTAGTLEAVAALGDGNSAERRATDAGANGEAETVAAGAPVAEDDAESESPVRRSRASRPSRRDPKTRSARSERETYAASAPSEEPPPLEAPPPEPEAPGPVAEAAPEPAAAAPLAIVPATEPQGDENAAPLHERTRKPASRKKTAIAPAAPTKDARSKRAAPAKKSSAAKKPSAKASAAKKASAKKPAAKAVARTTASRGGAGVAKKKTAASKGSKVAKRAVAAKRPAAKKSIAKKGAAKKKKSRR